MCRSCPQEIISKARIQFHNVVLRLLHFMSISIIIVVDEGELLCLSKEPKVLKAQSNSEPRTVSQIPTDTYRTNGLLIFHPNSSASLGSVPIKRDRGTCFDGRNAGIRLVLCERTNDPLRVRTIEVNGEYCDCHGRWEILLVGQAMRVISDKAFGTRESRRPITNLKLEKFDTRN